MDILTSWRDGGGCVLLRTNILHSRWSYMRLLTLCPAGPGGPLSREDKSSLVPPDITSLFTTSPCLFPDMQT